MQAPVLALATVGTGSGVGEGGDCVQENVQHPQQLGAADPGALGWSGKASLKKQPPGGQWGGLARKSCGGGCPYAPCCCPPGRGRTASRCRAFWELGRGGSSYPSLEPPPLPSGPGLYHLVGRTTSSPGSHMNRHCPGQGGWHSWLAEQSPEPRQVTGNGPCQGSLGVLTDLMMAEV